MSRKIAQLANGVQRCCSHMATVKVPKDGNLCLTFVATKKKPASRFTKKGDDLKSMGHGIQRKCTLVATIFLREGSLITLFNILGAGDGA